MKKFLSLFLGILFLAACLSACDQGENSTDGGNNEHQQEETVLEETGHNIVENGVSEYRLLLPADASSREVYAADELNLYLSRSTGVTLAIDREVSASQKYLSVGRTALAQELDDPVTYEALGDDGFYLKTQGDDLVMTGFGGDGTLFSVYEFLKLTLGIRFYAEDEILVPQAERVPLYKFDIKEKPDFEERSLGYLATQGNSSNALHMRLGEGVGNWGLWAHTHFSIINKDLPSGQSYKDLHSDWFSSDGTQLCLTNPEMREKFIENLKTIILENPTAEYFMLGQEDQNTFCTCKNCTVSNAANGGESGTQMIFVNYVAREIAKWLKEEGSERQITLVTFAYCKTEDAPVIYDEKTDTYSLVNESVRAEDNVGVMFAPIYACYSHSILDKNCNALSRSALLGWEQVTDKLMVWSYSSNFAAYLQPFDNYNSLVENYRAYHDHKVVYIYDQGIYNSYDSFHDLRVFVQSSLLWDTQEDVAELTDEFFANYYKEAADAVRSYYELIKTHYRVIEQESLQTSSPFHSYCTWNLGVQSLTAAQWPKAFFNQCLKLFDQAYEAISSVEDEEVKAKLEERVTRETLYVRYMLLELYPGYYSTAQLKEMIDSFEYDAYRCGVTRYVSADGIVGGPDLSRKITEWRNELL